MNFRIMSKDKISYGKQDFKDNTIEVHTNNEIVVCDMYQDEDGDFLFYYEGELHWLKDCQRI